jgi:hypothetical protein
MSTTIERTVTTVAPPGKDRLGDRTAARLASALDRR